MKVNTVILRHAQFCTLTPTLTTKLWGTKTKPGMGMPLLTETTVIAKPTETIAKTGKQLGTQH